MNAARRLAVGLLCAIGLASSPTLASAAADGPTVPAVRLDPVDEGRILFGSGSYSGTMTIVEGPDGLALVERQSIDGYLAGIREVPLSWPEEALEAQAIAARTYLAWTLRRGRSAAGDAYGFDICASTNCQVYRGAGVVDGESGPRWLAALDATSDRILVYDEGPAQALYSASHGVESRGVEEIWGGDGLPYLVRVSSPEEGVSPFDSWLLEIPTEIFREVLRSGGVPIGSVVTGVRVLAAPGDISRLEVQSSSGVTTLPLTRVRAIFNVHGPERYPGLFPGDRRDGRRLPQSIPSYSFTASLTPSIADSVPRGPQPMLAPDELPENGTVSLTGHGWGHGVGMSQWGAYAMADGGATAEDILSHYYGGLVPQAAGDLLPAEVRVGLVWGVPTIEFEVVGSAIVATEGRPDRRLEAGRWRARVVGEHIVMVPVYRGAFGHGRGLRFR